MERYELEKLRDLPIEVVAERLGLRVSRHKCLCPFHDDHHASMSFNVRTNKCRCFVCMDKSLGTIDLVMKYLNKDFVEACKWLADGNLSLTLPEREGTKIDTPPRSFDAKRYERFFEHPWLSDEARAFLYAERKLDPRVIRWCRLTSWQDRQGIHWLQIPYYDVDGTLIGIQNRNLTPSLRGRDGERLSRFRFPQGSRCSVYNLPVLKMLKADEPMYITEGCSDCWAMLSSGHKAIAIPSATLLKPSDIETITRPLSESWRGSFHMFPDQDEPGERLFLQLKSFLLNIVHHQLPHGCKDYSDYYLKTLQGKVSLSNK